MNIDKLIIKRLFSFHIQATQVHPMPASHPNHTLRGYQSIDVQKAQAIASQVDVHFAHHISFAWLCIKLFLVYSVELGLFVVGQGQTLVLMICLRTH